MKELKKRVLYAVGLLFFVVSFGTAGYMIIEEWDFSDALYMTVITLASVGYKEVHELSFPGRIFTIIIIVLGVGTVAYALSAGAKIIT